MTDGDEKDREKVDEEREEADKLIEEKEMNEIDIEEEKKKKEGSEIREFIVRGMKKNLIGFRREKY